MRYDTNNTYSDMYRIADDLLLHIFTVKRTSGINPADYVDNALDNIHDSVFFSYTYTNNN